MLLRRVILLLLLRLRSERVSGRRDGRMGMTDGDGRSGRVLLLLLLLLLLEVKVVLLRCLKAVQMGWREPS